MAEMNRLTLRVPADEVLMVGTGGEGRTRAAYVDGQRQADQVVQRKGADLHRLSGLAVSVCDAGLDGAVVETTMPMTDVPAGTIFKASGDCEVAIRADARPGFNGGDPRGVLAVTVYVERLVPAGNVADLLKLESAAPPDAPSDQPDTANAPQQPEKVPPRSKAVA